MSRSDVPPDLSPWEDRARVDHIGRLAAEGGLADMADQLLFAGQCEGFRAAARLRAMPVERRRALAAVLDERTGPHGSMPALRERGMVTLAMVSRGFVTDSWCDEWTAMLEDRASRSYWFGTSDDVPCVAEAVLDAGRTLPADVVGMLRRSACAGSLGWAEMLLERLPEPLLNPGEPWADRILAELPALGVPWRDLVVHLRTAPGAPTRRWDRAAAAIIAAIGPETVRRTASPWLALATHGGGGPEGCYDPWDIGVLPGLARLLSLLPPHPETVRILGALVERPPVKSVVAGAGVHALARLDGGAGRAELHRLTGCVDHKVTLRQLHRALAR